MSTQKGTSGENLSKFYVGDSNNQPVELARSSDIPDSSTAGIGAVIKSYPVTDGMQITAGDVVDVVNDELTVSYDSIMEFNQIDTSPTTTKCLNLSNKYSIILTNSSSSANKNYLYLVDNETEEIIDSKSFTNESGIVSTELFRINDTKFIVLYNIGGNNYLKICLIENDKIGNISNSESGGVGDCNCIVINESKVIVFYSRGTNDVFGYLYYYIYDVSTNSLSRLIANTIINSTTSISNIKSCIVSINSSIVTLAVFYLYANKQYFRYDILQFNDDDNSLTAINQNTQLMYVSTVYDYDISFNINTNKLTMIYFASGFSGITVSDIRCYNFNSNILNLSYSLNLLNVNETATRTNLSIAYVNDNTILVQRGASVESRSDYLLINDNGNAFNLIKYYQMDFFQQIADSTLKIINSNKVLSCFIGYSTGISGLSSYYCFIKIKENDFGTQFNYSSSQAIALQSGNAGDIVNVIYSGITQANWIAQGEQILSDGVRGVGILDGVLQVVGENISDVKIVTGNYIGTGAYGNNNPNILEFNGTPKILIISSLSASVFVVLNDSESYGSVVRVPSGTGEIQVHEVGFNTSGNTVSWFSNNTSGGNGVVQLNKSGVTYNYAAIFIKALQ